jgi:hypothetical protein
MAPRSAADRDRVGALDHQPVERALLLVERQVDARHLFLGGHIGAAATFDLGESLLVGLLVVSKADMKSSKAWRHRRRRLLVSGARGGLS